ncbi:MAG: hypothetical protein EBS86_14745 [Crocinitomicaceae bacterium]|nr:hypothetical protein [Crocinitomicaceae bacterium]
MADSGIKKARIVQESLPPINSEIEGYSVRYRIVSDDKNRTSQWSPVIQILPNYTYVSGTSSFNKAGNVGTLVWDSVSIQKDGNEIRKAHEFDIWLKWDRNDSGDWLYKQRIDGGSISFPIPSTYTIGGVVQGSQPNRLTAEIYLKGTPITRDYSFLLVYTSGPHTV